jgi:hypothetical protein
MRRLNLLLHVTSSAGWWGAVLVFLVLAIAGLGGVHEADCRALALTGWAAIVPLAAVSSLSGLVLSLSGAWGLARHWWVLFKGVMTLPCSALLLLHLQGLETCAAGTAAQMTVDAALALVVLMVPMVLSIYKPRGTTPWSRRG